MYHLQKVHLLLLACLLAAPAFPGAGGGNGGGNNAEASQALRPLPVHRMTTRNIVAALSLRHYVPTTLDNKLSEKIFDAYIDNLDPSKSYFLASDLQDLGRYRNRMDEALRHENLNPVYEIFNRYHVRFMDRFERIIAMLEEGEEGIDGFDFNKTEHLLIDRELAPWASSPAELDELWRKRIKDSVLNLRLTDKEPEAIRELLIKRFKNRLARAKQTNSEDVYQLYMNAFTRTYDPHTQYFSPKTSENFNINMSLSLEGIGAVLQLEDEYTKIVSLVPAGPADKTGLLKPNDRIIAVGQGQDGEMVDVIGWRLDEVVQLIRGKKNTLVRLDIIPSGSSDSSASKIIRITRNKVELEEQSAQSSIIEIEQFGHVRRIGVVDIPTFYVDFQAMQKGDRNFKSTTRDVKKLILALVKEDLDGIVIDIRDNGGGSLQEARMLTGLFIDYGPTVQVRSKSNRVDILADKDRGVIYDGPLAVLVNRLSASASEIFAGAIQDYQRGIIIGSQTFGKGTVQSLVPLNRGQLKLTQAKFYRISGESTQEKGIIPDIVYPSSYDPDTIGESTLDHPLPWDIIKAANYRAGKNINHLVPELRALHLERVANHPEFDYLKEAFAYRKARKEENTISLNEMQRLAEKQDRESFWLALENRKRLAQGLSALASLDELTAAEPTIANVKAPAGGAGALVPSPQEGEDDGPVPGSEMAGAGGASNIKAGSKEPVDFHLVEGGHILLDLISLEKRTAADGLRSQGS